MKIVHGPLIEFEENINRISDDDFGDFKRKATTYISRLAPQLVKNKRAFAKLAKMKKYVAYDDNLRPVDFVKEQLLEDVQNLKDMLDDKYNN